LYLARAATGSEDPPDYDTGAGGFVAGDDRLQQLDGRAGLCTYQQFTYHAAGDRWALDQFNQGVMLS
jgi:hypothetical protein